MQLHAVIQVSQDGRNWTPIGDDPPIPVAFLAGYAFVRAVLIYVAEKGDEMIDVTPETRDT
jgi:hypothetical protein